MQPRSWRGLAAALTFTASLGAGAHYGTPTPLASLPKPAPVFAFPFAGPPGPDTWLLGQGYGNTTGAYGNRRSMYAAGQGIHFGVDIAARCGTPVLAIGDGRVAEVDGPHGSPPHNLVIDHPNGLSSLYGHLMRRATIPVGTQVKRGQVVALSGDSQGTCHSAPHLHLEIRDRSHQRFLNPVLYVAADWDSLALAGGFGGSFERDLNDPRRWQASDDQPNALRGGPLLNDFRSAWPPDRSGR